MMFVGPCGNTHVGSSLHRAALARGLDSQILDTRPAYAGPAPLRVLLWRLAGRRPIRLRAFSRHVLDSVKTHRPHLLVTLGQAPVTADALRAIRSLGVHCANFSTDDPFNPAHAAPWQLKALKEYDIVFNPRRGNMADMRGLCRGEIFYLPFAYDEALFEPAHPPAETGGTGQDILFVGGADRDRATFFEAFLRHGLTPTLVGGYWDRYAALRPFSLGQKEVGELSVLTARAAVNLCLVRRANRDGHVMRSYEIPAAAGFLLAEDTIEHHDIFGEEGKATLYFKTPKEAADKCRWALAHPSERRRMADAGHRLVTGGGHTYKDRLNTMLQAVSIV
jgi:spore maturation protein CgeB